MGLGDQAREEMVSHPCCPPALSQDMTRGWPGSSPLGNLWQASFLPGVLGTPLGPSFDCLGSQFCLLIEQEKSKGLSRYLNVIQTSRTCHSLLTPALC